MRISSILAALCLATPVIAQTAEQEVLKVVTQMFDGMRNADSAAVRAVFVPGARFASIDPRATPPSVRFDSVGGWINGIAGSNKRWNEQIYDVQVKVDGDMAHVWSPYTFYLDGKWNHCGVNSMELLKINSAWKLTQLSDTRKREACRDPLGGGPRQATPPGTPAHEFWNRLQALCGRAYEGVLTEGQAADSVFLRSRLVIHARACSPTEIRIALHSGADRSRTWVLTRTDAGLRLKHDHQHEDGTPDRVTDYGGDTRDSGSPARQDFHADTYTAALVPTAATNVWTMEIDPGKRFAYSLRREGRHVRLEFDLTRPVPAPPAPWGTRDPELQSAGSGVTSQ